MKTLQAIQDAFDEVYQSKLTCDALINEMCPVGSHVNFTVRSGVSATGEVVRECHFGSISVRNIATGKAYRIDARSIYHADA